MQNKGYFGFLCKSADGIIQTNSHPSRRDYVKQYLFIQVFHLEPFYMSSRVFFNSKNLRKFEDNRKYCFTVFCKLNIITSE
jgi:hypothetical protein